MILGATAIHALARVVLMVAPDDDEQMVLGVVKSNLAENPARCAGPVMKTRPSRGTASLRRLWMTCFRYRGSRRDSRMLRRSYASSSKEG